MPLEPFENEGNFQEDVGLFEAAAHARPVEIGVPRVEVIHVAPDGSNQDATARHMAAALAEHLAATVYEQTGAATAAEILAEVRGRGTNLLVLPVPFGGDYQTLKGASLGSVVDVLLLEAPCPVLCIRENLSAEAIRDVLSDVLVPLAAGDEHAERAVAWAFRLVAAHGSIELLLAADRDVLDEARRVLPPATDPLPWEPERLQRALVQDVGGLISAMQHRGQETGVTVHVETRVGRFVQLVADHAEARRPLIVWGTSREHASPAFHRSVDLILASQAPVLIV